MSHAQQADDSSDDILVTSSRAPTTLSEVPNSVTIVSEETLRRQLDVARNVDRVLQRTIPGIGEPGEGNYSASDTGTGPALRGRPATVLLNGVPVNTLLRGNGIDTQQIDPNAIGRIEVKRGASAAFGFGASGGIILFDTRRGTTDSMEVNMFAGVDFATRRVSDSFTAEAYAGAGQRVSDKFDFYAGFGYTTSGISVGPRGETLAAPETTSLSFDGNFGFRFNDNVEFRVIGTFYRRDINRSYITADYLPYFDEDLEDYVLPVGVRTDETFLDPTPASRRGFQEAATLIASLTVDELAGGSLGITLFGQSNIYREPSLDAAYETLENQAFYEFDQQIDNKRIGIRSNYTREFKFSDTRSIRLTGGFDWLRDRMFRSAFSGSADLPPRGTIEVPGYGLQPYTGGQELFPTSPPVELASWALFGQVDLRIDRLLLTGGIRHEDSAPRSRGYSSTPGTVPAGKLPGFDVQLFNFGAVFEITDRIQLYGGLSQGVEVSELGRVLRSLSLQRIDEAGEITVADLQGVDLQPAVTTEYEIGVRGRAGPVRFTLAGFYSSAPFAARVQLPPGAPPTALFEPVREPTRIWGLEATVDATVSDRLTLGALFSWQDGEFRPEEETAFLQIPYARLAAPRLVAFADYRLSDRIEFTLQGNKTFSVSSFPNLPLESFGGSGAADGNVDGYFTLDVAARIEAGPGQISIGASNVTNARYLDAATQAFRDSFVRLPAAGRRLSIAYTARF